MSGSPIKAERRRIFAEALQRELTDGGTKDLVESVRAIARALIAKGQEGEIPAIKEIADRLEGKSTEHVAVSAGDSVKELTEEQLLAIAARGREGDPEPQGGEAKPTSVH